LEDLLAPLATRPSSELQALKKSTKMLSSSKKGTLSAPLPTRAQERLDREAAYEQTKEEVDKWSATMKRIKEVCTTSTHVLSMFSQLIPLGRAPELPAATGASESDVQPRTQRQVQGTCIPLFALHYSHVRQPTTELETAVDRLLKTARLREQDMQQTEDLKMNHLTPEEAQARRAELRKMRELMFRAETKAKRVAKIKSKSYRRIKKKERAKLAEKLGDTVADDPDDEEARLRREVERARERATLRHKNTGKWAKSMHSRGEMDEEQRENMNDMLDRGEKLRRRIQGVGSGEEESEDDDMDSDADPEALKAGAFNELQALRREEDVDPADGASKKSVFKMKFMQDAMKRDMHRVDRSIDDFVNEMGGQLSGEERGTSEPPTQNADEPTVERAGGRVSFRPGQMASSVLISNQCID
jgi:U3 small nucleolar RNA-associated protein 14